MFDNKQEKYERDQLFAALAELDTMDKTLNALVYAGNDSKKQGHVAFMRAAVAAVLCVGSLASHMVTDNAVFLLPAAVTLFQGAYDTAVWQKRREHYKRCRREWGRGMKMRTELQARTSSLVTQMEANNDGATEA